MRFFAIQLQIFDLWLIIAHLVAHIINTCGAHCIHLILTDNAFKCTRMPKYPIYMHHSWYMCDSFLYTENLLDRISVLFDFFFQSIITEAAFCMWWNSLGTAAAWGYLTVFLWFPQVSYCHNFHLRLLNLGFLCRGTAPWAPWAPWVP